MDSFLHYMVEQPSTVGLVALAVIDVPSKHIKLGR